MATIDSRRDRQALRLVVIDADPRVRESLVALLGCEGGIDVVGSAGNPQGALEVVEATAPHVVILDPRLPESEVGLALISVLRERRPDLVVLVMSWSDALESTSVDRGADGFVPKSLAPSELAATIESHARASRRRTSDGDAVPSPDVVARRRATYRSAAQRGPGTYNEG